MIHHYLKATGYQSLCSFKHVLNIQTIIFISFLRTESNSEFKPTIKAIT